MGSSGTTDRRAVGYHNGAAAEILLFEALRCWMAGYETGDIACWDLAWDALCREVPVESAKPLFGELQHFARTMRSVARQPLGWRPFCCRGLCKDECIVLALLDAAQRFDEEQLDLALRHLVPLDESGRTRQAAIAFSQALARAGLFIAPVSPAALDAVIAGRPVQSTHPPSSNGS